MKKAEILRPATFPDAIGAGEFVRNGETVHVGCPGCGVVQRVEDPTAIFVCVSPSCPAMVWLELAGAN